MRLPLAFAIAAATLSIAAAGQPSPSRPSADPYAGETKAQRDKRMQWWREARFGMFIHWGVYSVPAGAYDGRQIGGIGEWIMNSARIPVARYREYAKQFNPVKYNADEWVRTAKAAGMKYIIITSKHHDGFAMFDSRASDWNIVKATAFGRDPLKELAAACRKHGLRLGFYYSQAQDWTNPGGAAAGGHWDPAQDGDMTTYIRNVAVPQVREILSNYGHISVLWWDTPVDITKDHADMLLPLLKLQPGIIHNNRLGGGYRGDSETPEQFVPPTGYPGRDWETCMTINDTWGYRSYDHDWKSPETLIRNLVDIASKGGNYLLNVGPTNLGEIPAPSVERLRTVGEWMKVNGEAIYATSPSPFKRLPWGRCTRKSSGSSTTLYLHVFDWPSDGRLLVPGLKNRVTSCALLASTAKLRFSSTDAGVEISVPRYAPGPVSSTVVLKIAGAPDVENVGLAQAADGTVRLPAADAICHGSQLQYETGDRRDNIGFWLDASDWVEWQFRVTKPGTFTVAADIAGTSASSFTVAAGGEAIDCSVAATGDYGEFRTFELGTLAVDKAGMASLTVKPVAGRWSPINLKAVRLTPR